MIFFLGREGGGGEERIKAQKDEGMVRGG